jgi:hypothetical protein
VEDLVGNRTTKKWWFKRYLYTPPEKKAVNKGNGKKHSDSYRKGSGAKKKELTVKKTVSKKKK